MSIVAHNTDSLQAEIEWLWLYILEDDTAHKKVSKVLTGGQQELMGLGSKEVVLAVGGSYVLSRQGMTAFILELDTQRKHSFKLTSEKFKGDSYHRFRLNKSQILEVSGLEDYLCESRILDSLRSDDGKLYLHRLSHAIAYPDVDIYWQRGRAEHLQIEVSHQNRICCDDRASNLRAMVRTEHKALDDSAEVIDFWARLAEREKVYLDAEVQREDRYACAFTEACVLMATPEQYWEDEYLVA